MTEFKQQPEKDVKKPLARKRKIPWVLCIVLLITIFLATRAVEVLAKQRQANKMNKAYDAELNQLAEKEANLHAELEELATEDGIEQEIREKFRVTKEGEELVVIVPQKKTATTDTESKGLFSFLRNLFK